MRDYMSGCRLPKPPNQYVSKNRPPPAPKKSANDRGYTYRWQKASKQFLALNPLCVHCREAGMTIAATDVDHIVPHRGDQKLFWDQANWQGLCEFHHGRKSAGERL